MAQISIRPEFPNILIVSGVDVYNPETLAGLTMSTLDHAVGTAVAPGTHEFWIFQPVPNFAGPAQYVPADDGASPHRRRGIVQMYGKLPTDTASMSSYLSTLMQEVGHCWLSPNDMMVAGKRTATLAELIQALNDNVPFSHPPLIARDDSHWSAYWRADGSPMDGINFEQIGVEDGNEIWAGKSPFTEKITLSGNILSSTPHFGPDDTSIFSGPRVPKYNDLDLYIMGARSVNEAYRGEEGVVWMQPQITENVESHAGVVVVWGPRDQLMFGFDQSDRTISLRNARGDVLGSAQISPNYHPLASTRNGILLRVVRRGGNQYFFQARIAAAGGWLDLIFGRSLPYAWDDLEPSNHIDVNNNFTKWRTVAATQVDGEPLAFGLFVNRWRLAHLTDASFYRFQIKVGTATRSIPTTAVPPTVARGDYGALNTGGFSYEATAGTLVRSAMGRLHLTTPIGVASGSQLSWYNDDTFRYVAPQVGNIIDNAPRMLMKSPTGDFSFVTHARLDRTIVAPQAGNGALNKPVYGKTSRVSVRDIKLSKRSLALQQHPPGNIYRMAFIAVTPDASTVSLDDLAHFDAARRYWEACFKKITAGRLHADTTL